jgi:hypothetical protein
MAQGLQRDPLSIASGGLPGLYGTTFSPIPATEGDVAARSRAVVPQFGGAPAQILTTPTFRPTAQAVLPTPLLRRPEEVGRAAFRQIREETQFPTLKPAETIEEIDNRLRSILPVTETAPPQQPVPGGSGSILEPPTPPPPPLPPSVAVEAVIPTTPLEQPLAPLTTLPPAEPTPPPTTISPVETTPPPSRPVIALTAPPPQLTPPPTQPYSSLMQIFQALAEPGAGFDRDYGPSFDRGGSAGSAVAVGPSGSTGTNVAGGYAAPAFEVGLFDRDFGWTSFDREYA